MKQRKHEPTLVESNHHKKTISLFFVAFVAIITFVLFEYVMLKKQEIGSSNKTISSSVTESPISYKVSGKVVQISPDRHVLILKPTTIKTAGNAANLKQPSNVADQLIPLVPEITEISYLSNNNATNNPSSRIKLSTLTDSQIHGLIGSEISLMTTDDKTKTPAPYASIITVLR